MPLTKRHVLKKILAPLYIDHIKCCFRSLSCSSVANYKKSLQNSLKSLWKIFSILWIIFEKSLKNKLLKLKHIPLVTLSTLDGEGIKNGWNSLNCWTKDFWRIVKKNGTLLLDVESTLCMFFVCFYSIFSFSEETNNICETGVNYNLIL